MKTNFFLYSSERPLKIAYGNIYDVVDVNAEENFYITPAGCYGIIRRREERKLTINKRLEVILRKISSQWSSEKIEEISRKQTRGRFSSSELSNKIKEGNTLSLFD